MHKGVAWWSTTQEDGSPALRATVARGCAALRQYSDGTDVCVARMLFDSLLAHNLAHLNCLKQIEFNDIFWTKSARNLKQWRTNLHIIEVYNIGLVNDWKYIASRIYNKINEKNTIYLTFMNNINLNYLRWDFVTEIKSFAHAEITNYQVMRVINRAQWTSFNLDGRKNLFLSVILPCDNRVYIVVGHTRFEWALIYYSNITEISYIQQKLIENLSQPINLTEHCSVIIIRYILTIYLNNILIHWVMNNYMALILQLNLFKYFYSITSNTGIQCKTWFMNIPPLLTNIANNVC